MVEGGYDNEIHITHYINPHMFWFKFYEECILKSKMFYELENKVQESCENPQRIMMKYEPKVNEVVAVFYFPWMRWLRAIVEDIAVQHTSTKYIMWAIDFGIPVQSESRWIRNLPEELALVDLHLIHFGGLNNVVPAENTYDFLANRPTIQLSDIWSPAAVNMIHELINNADKIVFDSEVTKDEQMLGNLKVTTTHQINEVQAKVLLLETGHAIDCNALHMYV